MISSAGAILRRWSAAVVVVVLAMPALPALADFLGSDQESHSLATATLAAPTSPSTARGVCTGAADQIIVNWTATTSTWATNQQLLRSTTSGGPYTVVATKSTAATSHTDAGLAHLTTYYYRVRATKGAWTADTAEVSMTTRSAVCV